jgi:hydrogenase maturation protease
MNRRLILGIGNLLMGDEGVGIHIVRHIEKNFNLENVDIVDGGTGGFHLLEFFQNYNPVILIDATMDGKIPGTLNFLKPKFSSDYPQTLTANDIGLKDLLDALYLLNKQPETWLFIISIPKIDKVTMELTPEINEAIPVAAKKIVETLQGQSL